jgi:membrane dipeptidase
VTAGEVVMPVKTRASYRPFQYLEPDTDYREFRLAKELERVPSRAYPLEPEQERRLASILEGAPLVSSHDHCIVMPDDMSEIHEYARERRSWTGYEGLAAAGVDVVLEAFLDGMGGWRWDDVVFDLGMRYSDIAHQDFVYRAETIADLERAKPSGRCALVSTLEAATPIEDDVDRVDVLYGLGVRVMGITYSESNALGTGLREERDGGLTDLGQAVVRRMNRLGMTIDVSHCSDRTSLDTIEMSERPILITHAGARRLWNTKRMKPDEVLRACAAKGGVIGVEAAPHTTLTEKNPRHSVESVMEHVAYCVELMGVDHVGLGPDTLFGDHVGLHKAFAAALSISRIQKGVTYTPVPYVEGMESPAEAMPNAARWLVAHGYPDTDTAKILGGNVLRVLRQTWAR